MRVAVLLAVLVTLDGLTTYLLALRYPAHLELNPVLRQLLALDSRLVFAYAPVEYLLLLLLFRAYRWFLRRVGIRRRLEYIVVLLPLVAVVSNLAGLLL
jgi:type II secretory pathway component PulF